jgi:hypothetical protein
MILKGETSVTLSKTFSGAWSMFNDQLALRSKLRVGCENRPDSAVNFLLTYLLTYLLRGEEPFLRR